MGLSQHELRFLHTFPHLAISAFDETGPNLLGRAANEIRTHLAKTLRMSGNLSTLSFRHLT